MRHIDKRRKDSEKQIRGTAAAAHGLAYAMRTNAMLA